MGKKKIRRKICNKIIKTLLVIPILVIGFNGSVSMSNVFPTVSSFSNLAPSFNVFRSPTNDKIDESYFKSTNFLNDPRAVVLSCIIGETLLVERGSGEDLARYLRNKYRNAKELLCYFDIKNIRKTSEYVYLPLSQEIDGVGVVITLQGGKISNERYQIIGQGDVSNFSMYLVKKQDTIHVEKQSFFDKEFEERDKQLEQLEAKEEEKLKEKNKTDNFSKKVTSLKLYIQRQSFRELMFMMSRLELIESKGKKEIL